MLRFCTPNTYITVKGTKKKVELRKSNIRT